MEEDSEDEAGELPDRFFKERRLLLAVSVVLLAHQLLGITVSKSAETLGFHFEVEDPSKIWWGMWLIWAWSAISYIQQLNSIRPRSMYPEDRAAETRAKLADWVITSRVRRTALKHLRLILPGYLRAKFEVRLIDRITRETPQKQLLLLTVVDVSARWNQNDAASEAELAAVFEREMKSAEWDISGGGCGHEQGISHFHRSVSVRSKPIEGRRWIRVVAGVWASLSTPFLTDYYAPLLIGGAPVLVAAVQLIASLRR